MSVPYTPPMITRRLNTMPLDRLAVIKPRDFQTWPTVNIVPAKTIEILITDARVRRMGTQTREAK